MAITPQLIENLAGLAVQFSQGAALVAPEKIVDLVDEYGDDGVFQLRIELGEALRFHFDHKAPDGVVTAIFTVEGVTGAELEAEARKQGKSAAIH